MMITVKNCKVSEISPYLLANKSGRILTGTYGRHETPGSDTKYFVSHNVASVLSFMSPSFFLCPIQTSWVLQRPSGCHHTVSLHLN